MRNLNLSQRVKLAFIVSFCTLIAISLVMIFAASKMTEDYIFEAQLAAQLKYLDLSRNDIALPTAYKLYLNKESIDPQIAQYVSATEPGIYELEPPGELDYHYAVIARDTGNAYLFYNVHELELDESIERQLLHTIFVSFLILMLCTLLFMRTILKRSLTPMYQLIRALSAHTKTPNAPLILPPLQDNEIGLLNRTITQYSKRLSEFIQREKEFSQFASHELRTPVMVSKGAIELLRLQVKTSDPLSKPLARLERATANMEEVIDTLLNLAREQNHTHCEYISLVDAIDGVVELWQEKAKLKKQFIKVASKQLNEHTYPKAQLEMVLNNLIKNAIQHGSVDTINITICAGYCHINNKRAHDNHLPANEPSFGLGIMIVKRVYEQQNWHFDFQQTETDFSSTVLFSEHVKA